MCAHVPLCDVECVTKCIIHTVTIPFVIQIWTPLGRMLTPGQQACTGTFLGKPTHVVTLCNTWYREEQRTSWKSSLWIFQMASPYPFYLPQLLRSQLHHPFLWEAFLDLSPSDQILLMHTHSPKELPFQAVIPEMAFYAFV